MRFMYCMQVLRRCPSWLLLYCRFQHGYDSYMLHAFPHDELKPISQDYTDSLGDS